MKINDPKPKKRAAYSPAINRRKVVAGLLAAAGFAIAPRFDAALAAESAKRVAFAGSHSIVVRTTENVTEGGWVWLLNSARDAGVKRIYLLVKQEENEYASEATKRTLRSGELLVPVPGGVIAEGWADPAWLDEMLARAASFGIEVHAWWPLFQDAVAAEKLREASYHGKEKEIFVDPARPEVTTYQSALLTALLERYPFDGVALDWIRYSARQDGSAGPLGQRFADIIGKPWSNEAMADPLARALWDDLRARTVADWVKDFLANIRPRYPTLTWSAFVLPWIYKEVAQSYRHLAAAGLDSLQPMIYWRDWNEEADFTAEIVRPAPFHLSGRTSLEPTFDITVEEGELHEACDLLPKDRLGGITWYQHGVWSEADFQKLKKLSASVAGKQRALYEEATPEPERFAAGAKLEPIIFPPDASMWSFVCFGELYRRDALAGADPLVPVLTLHQFVKGALESGATDWHTSTDYLDAVIKFLSAHRFNTVTAETLAAYMTSEDKTLLPERPVVIIIDDGSASIVDHFEPRAAAAKLKYSVALVTGWMRDGEGHLIEVDKGVMDRVLTWPQTKKLAEGGWATFISHSHELHHFAASGADGAESGPATTERLWIKEEKRQEAEAERLRRVFRDLAAAREELAKRTGQATTLLVWPFGARDDAAEAVGREAGFTHFFEFAGSAFAAPRRTPQRIMRVAVTLADEAIPVSFPKDPLLAQRWWLAFLNYARRCMSVELIEAALDQLDEVRSDHPEAYISRAAVLVLQGHSTLAWRRMKKLRDIYPHDSAVHSSIDEFEESYRSLG